MDPVVDSKEEDKSSGLGEENNKKRQRPNAGQTHHQQTLKHPQWTYLHLQYMTTASSKSWDSPAIDMLTLRQDLTRALNQFLGLTGTAIPVDILQVDGADAWIRVPRLDGSAVHEALSGWSGGRASSGAYRWLVKGKGDWLFRLTAGDGQDLFKD
jgi:ribonuclease P/MRP protein subunit POP8